MYINIGYLFASVSVSPKFLRRTQSQRALPRIRRPQVFHLQGDYLMQTSQTGLGIKRFADW
jgi:hypothetical protein